MSSVMKSEELMLFQLKNRTPREVLNALSAEQKDYIYRAVWFDHVIEDVTGRLEERDILDKDDSIKNNVAQRYVYQGDYDCNLSYWDNIDNLIDEVLKELDPTLATSILVDGIKNCLAENSNKEQDGIVSKIFQFSYESNHEPNGIGNITCFVKGTKEKLELAELLWRVCIDLSNANFRCEDIATTLEAGGYEKEEIIKILKIFFKPMSQDPITAYDQCIAKFNEMGLTVKYVYDDNVEADVWTSYGVY